jgi:hypothetical protein
MAFLTLTFGFWLFSACQIETSLMNAPLTLGFDPFSGRVRSDTRSIVHPSSLRFGPIGSVKSQALIMVILNIKTWPLLAVLEFGEQRAFKVGALDDARPVWVGYIISKKWTQNEWDKERWGDV